MAGRGRPPKLPEERAGRAVPTRGEWQTLPPLTKPILPPLPLRGRGNGRWSTRTQQTWKAWREDWVTQVYGPAEIAMAVELAFIYELAVRNNQSSMWSEVRQWMDRLGLTMKGKQDLRLRQAESEALPEKPKGGKLIRLVNDAVAAK